MATDAKKTPEATPAKATEAKPIRVDNRTKALCTIFNNTGHFGGTVELKPGINEDVPGWVTDEPYFVALKKEGIVGVLAKDDDTPAVIKYATDANGVPIQAVDDKGEPVFDEKTGEPVFVLAQE